MLCFDPSRRHSGASCSSYSNSRLNYQVASRTLSPRSKRMLYILAPRIIPRRRSGCFEAYWKSTNYCENGQVLDRESHMYV
ncbi:hypothetical protein M404DRAFT_579114 [Pisolithus tinctorius Marx 270]|uniref:Uncharacterized protein n=1 Tax=Pisolithus tinctorius Marx 270 TaxID=870435 RepID=A0A0C3PWY5_PISTI|nr:hypothetical protein M404DRAFT_579114 [Pisolithus tinctorius Marx 270]